MRKITVTLLCAVVLCAALRAEEPDRESESWGALSESESYLKLLLPAAQDAIHILSTLRDPVFSEQKTVTLQANPDREVSVAVIFPTAKSFPGLRSHLRGSTHSFCQVVTENIPGIARNVIVCDPDAMRRLEILIRVSHEQRYFMRLKNDWAIMQLLGRIERDPVALLREVRPKVTDAHMRDHMTFILVFFLAHEAWHIKHRQGMRFAAAEQLFRDSQSDLAVKCMCRNYQEVERHGISMYARATPVPLAEEGTTEDPTARAYFEQTREIWQSELSADQYGGDMTARLAAWIQQHGATQDAVEQFVSEIIQNFGHIMLATWFSKLRLFSTAHCGEYAGIDFYLTRCMCKHKDMYEKVFQLFAATHPPIILRMYAASQEFAKRVYKDLDVDWKSSPKWDMAVARGWLVMLEGMVDVPLKISLDLCVKTSSLVAPNGRIVQVLPDLAGFVGPDASKKYPGYPIDEEALISQCTGVDVKPRREPDGPVAPP